MDIQRLRENLKLDAVILFGTDEIMAAADIYASGSCLIVEESGMALLCPEEQAGKEGLLRVEYAECGFERVENGVENLWRLVRKMMQGKKRIGYHKYNCPMALGELSAGLTEFVDISGEMAEEMLCKSPHFFESYTKVRELNTRAYDHIRRVIHAGCTEKELCASVKEIYASGMEQQVLYTGDFLSGRRTAEIAGAATDKIIMQGDTVIVDALCSCQGVFCDTTRTYFCGEPTERQEREYALLCALHEEIKPLLKPGTIAGDIYRYADRRLKEEGYRGLPHHAGHGLGYKWYEAPYFIEDCRTVLREDMLVAIEPGIYIQGQYGMRLENNYRVTRNGGIDVFAYKMDMDDFMLSGGDTDVPK